MSSLIRRIQKNIAKGMGYRRITDKASPLYGHIVDGLGQSVGRHWPHVKAVTKDTVKLHSSRTVR